MKIKLRLIALNGIIISMVKFNSIQKFGYENVFPSRTGFILFEKWNGFNIIHKYGGFGEEAFNDNSEKQVFVCQ